MKLIILLAVAALSSGAKLDRTYLPPSYAQTSGGNGQLLQAPESFPANNRNNDFTQATSNRFTQSNNANYQNNDYEQNSNDYSQDGNNYQNDESFGAGFDQNAGFDAFNQRPERPQAEEDRSAAILRLDNNNDGETYNYAYETSNGIAAEENGVATDGVKAQGGYSYTGDDGQVYSVRYTADENGFVPQGDHLPTPPPIPEEILKALEKNAQDEANGIYDDGSYNEGKYGNGDGQQNDEAGYNYNNNGNNFNAGGNFNNVNTFNNGNSFNAANNYEDSVITENALLRSNGAAFGKQNGQFGNQNGVEKAYLPPFQNNERAEVGLRQYNPAQNGFNNQANRGFNSQNGVEKAYLPPEQFGQNARSQADANTRYNTQNNAFRNQANGGFNTQNDVQKTYLPPQFGQRAQQSSRGNGAGLNRAYLPPNFERANQNAASRSFSAQRNGGIRTNPSDNVERSYLPPNAEEQTQRFRNHGFRNTGSAVRNGASREYLPPSNQERNSFV